MAEAGSESSLPITAVTVFQDGARVQRRGTLSVQPGLRPLVLGTLPPTVDPASVRIAVGGDRLALVNVEVRERHRSNPLRAEAARLRAEVEELRDAVQALDDEDAAERARLDFLGHLSEAAATALARAVSFGRAGRDDLTEMAAHLSADTAGALGTRRGIAQRARAARRELDAAQNRLAAAEKRDGRSVQYVEVSVTLEAAAATQAEAELSYHVERASWRPLYDLVLDGERLDVSYLAEITQRSGEDWPAAPLTLSTTRRGLHETLPELTPWYVTRARPLIARRGRSLMAGMAAGAGPSAAPEGPEPGAGESGALESGALESGTLESGALAPAAFGAALPAEASEAGAGMSYQLPRPLAVPADGGPHKSLVARFELDASLDHLAVPVLAAEAYLRATVTNSSSLLLLPGPARVFQGSRFVGETSLETVAAGEEFELQLGVDDQIRVERELRRRAASKAVISGSRTVDVAYEITAENHREGQARISVHDHIPVSADGEIKIRLREASPSPAEQDDLGELTWELRLEPGQKAAIRYRFTVEHPAQVTVDGL
jgi:uncharacterized protein (TIGR02231 family)